MGVEDQVHAENYALYLGDCCEALPGLPDGSVHLSVYSPPFGGLYHYSSSPRDLSNCLNYDQFFEHYRFVVSELHRLTKPGRVTAVHCSDIPASNTGDDHLIDFPGDIIRLHQDIGFRYIARYCIWKEPLAVRNRTMAKKLAHRTIVDDATLCGNAGADFVLVFRRTGANSVPVAHPQGLIYYAGEREMPEELQPFKNWSGNQIENRYSHWIWRQYASSFWDDIRLDRTLPFQDAKEPDDEKHIHPLQLDVIDRIVTLWSNASETVLTPFMGVGSEVVGALQCGRRAVGIELKRSYYRQAVKNAAAAKFGEIPTGEQMAMTLDVA